MANRRSGPEDRTVQLSEAEVRMLMHAAGVRLERLVSVRAAGTITGAELDRRIERWREVLRKLGEALDGGGGG